MEQNSIKKGRAPYPEGLPLVRKVETNAQLVCKKKKKKKIPGYK